MKWLLSNRRLKISLLLCFFCSMHLYAQETDSLPSHYEKRVERYTHRWSKLMPQYAKMQYAGSIGVVSFGSGWDYCKGRLETDILFGYVPKYGDSRGKLTFTLREQYIPWSLNLGQSQWSVQPLTCGLFMNTIIDGRFWEKEPGGKYPSDYYNFSTKVRFHIFLGQQFTVKLPPHKSVHQSISFYYQISSCDLYIASAWNNSYLKPKDYLSLAFGVKFKIL